ncbi:MAG TPA: aryl-sulfate sulfotransferase [Bryobacteraceae bacterium]|nr:aryl-sulfate sulfotransferase [Bryobacteraceae bacterium]
MKSRLFLGLALLAAVSIPLSAQMSVTISPSVTLPAPLGTLINWSATVAGANSGTLWYRFGVRAVSLGGSRLSTHTPQIARRSAFPPDLGFRTIVDYGPNSSLAWTSIDGEGVYEIEVSVRNLTTGEMAQSVVPFELTSLATSGTPVITPTGHPLVFIYSAGPCAAGSQMRVEFQSPEGFAQDTPYRQCDGTHSMNFYLAGMRSNAQYTVQHTLDDGNSAVTGPLLTINTPGIPLQAPRTAGAAAGAQSSEGILLQSVIGSNSIATDLNGNIVWYAPPDFSYLTRIQAGGTFLGILEDGTQDPSHQFFREFDLAGVTYVETNAARVGEQLAAMGMQPITCFHHEAIRLADGGYLVLAGSERILTGVQGPGAVDVLGDTIVVLDPNLQVVWAWDAFDHLDPHRAAILGEACTYPTTLACSVFYQAATANDWLHGNALQFTPDGNILYSTRHQDWLVKIDFANGTGSGDILWRLGQDGDFLINSPDPSPWFSHQHGPHFAADNTTLLVFDNGNTRIAANNQMGDSRGQVLQIDEADRLATLVLNTDLGVNSSALGTAQQLSNGDYHFDAGFIVDPASPFSRFSQALEVNANGQIDWGIEIYAQEYRSFRLNDLYTPPIQ